MGERHGNAERAWSPEGLFARCLRFYPADFREEFGPAMVEMFSCRLRESRGRPVAWVRSVLRECLSSVSGGLRMRLSGLRHLTPELRQTARALARRPGITVSAILALALGIGLSTIIFSVVYGTAYRPLPVPDGGRIIHLEQVDPARGRRALPVSYHDFQDWGAQQTTFEGLAAFYRGTVNLSDETTRPERYSGAFVTANAWDVLGVRPVLGRGFVQGEDRPGAPPVAILAYSVWDQRFQRDPAIVGRTIRVNGTPTTIVGVMPEGFGFPYWEKLWLPMRIDRSALERGGGPGLEVFGRLKKGTSLDEARAEFDGISARLAAAYPETNEGVKASLDGFIRAYHGKGGMTAAAFLLGFGLAVLLIACFNVANLLLARAMMQVRDVAVRVAMGASRARVVAWVLQQAVLLAAAGAVLGILLTTLGIRVLNRWIIGTATSPLPFWMELKVDGAALLFVLGAVGISVLAAGVLPALRASAIDVHATLADASRGNSSIRIGRLSRFLVLSQVTLTAMLLVLAGHLALQVSRYRNAVHGYPTRDVLTARVGLFEGVFPGRESILRFQDELVRRMMEKPGVEAVALTTALPGTQAEVTRAALEGASYSGREEMPRARVAYVSPGFFKTFSAPVLAGRSFTSDDDRDGPPVVLVNQPFADRFFGAENPVGRKLRLGWPEPEGDGYTVVGVVPDLDMDGTTGEKADPWGVYVPMAQADVRFLSIAVRTRGTPNAMAPILRDEVASLQRDTPIYFVQTLQKAITAGVSDMLLVGSLIWSLALAAFLLASVGLYGVTAFLASRRTREVGVRIALGATVRDVLALTLRQGSVQVLLGLSLGLILAMGSVAFLSRAGADVVPWSFPVAGAVFLVLGSTGLAAVFIPAWQATKVDPVEALRVE